MTQPVDHARSDAKRHSRDRETPCRTISTEDRLIGYLIEAIGISRTAKRLARPLSSIAFLARRVGAESPFKRGRVNKYRLDSMQLGEDVWFPVHPGALNGSIAYWQSKTGKRFSRLKMTRDGVYGVMVTRKA